MEVESLARWAKIKGVNLLGSGDFTHPTYLADLKKKLRPLGWPLSAQAGGARWALYAYC
jgi:hypothetical protein